MPIKRDWNHSPNSGPKSISISLGSMIGHNWRKCQWTASELIIPAACATTLCAISKTPITIFHVFVTMRMAAADLNTHLKIIQVSTSCRLFLSAIIWIRSSGHYDSQNHTCNRHHDGVGQILNHAENTAIPSLWRLSYLYGYISRPVGLQLSNIPERLLIMPPTSISFSQFVRASSKKSIRCQPPFRRPRKAAGAARISCRRRLDREKPGEQRYKDHTNNGYTSTGHKLLHAL